MAENLDLYSDSDFKKQFTRIIHGLSFGVSKPDKPLAFLLGGQSGAGKTRLQKIIMGLHGNNFIVINGDEYRSAHPNFHAIQAKYGMDAPAHTAAWAGAMVEALVDELSQQGYNLIIEGTLRTAQVPLQTASLLRERSYSTHLAIMAVKPEISLISCQIRYEQLRIAGTTPRAVDPKHHAKIVKEIAGNLAELEQSGMFETVSLYNRAGTCLLAAKYPTDDTPASAVMGDVLFGIWTEDEAEHYQDLQTQLPSAIAQTASITPDDTNNNHGIRTPFL